MTKVSEKPTTWILVKEEQVVRKKSMADRQIWWLSLPDEAITVHVTQAKLGLKPTFLGHPGFLVHNKSAGCN